MSLIQSVPYPELTTTARNLLTGVDDGYKIKNLTTSTYQMYEGSIWVDIFVEPHTQNTDTGTTSTTWVINSNSLTEKATLQTSGLLTNRTLLLDKLSQINEVNIWASGQTFSVSPTITPLASIGIVALSVNNAGLIQSSGILVTSLSSAISESHTQNTDGGTTASTWIVNSGSATKKITLQTSGLSVNRTLLVDKLSQIDETNTWALTQTFSTAPVLSTLLSKRTLGTDSSGNIVDSSVLSIIDATVGSSGANYTDLNSAFAAGCNVVRVITNLTLTADMSYSNKVIYINNGCTLTTAAYHLTGINNSWIGLGGTLNKAYTSQAQISITGAYTSTAQFAYKSNFTNLYINTASLTNGTTLGMFNYNIFKECYFNIAFAVNSYFFNNFNTCYSCTINGNGSYGYINGSYNYFYDTYFTGTFSIVSYMFGDYNFFYGGYNATTLTYSYNTLNLCSRYGVIKDIQGEPTCPRAGSYYNCNLAIQSYGGNTTTDIYFFNCNIVGSDYAYSGTFSFHNCTFPSGFAFNNTPHYIKMINCNITAIILAYPNCELDIITSDYVLLTGAADSCKITGKIGTVAVPKTLTLSAGCDNCVIDVGVGTADVAGSNSSIVDNSGTLTNRIKTYVLT